jgi:tRNA dimethylallyltransferase
MTARPFLRILLGPTASGKERVALRAAGSLGAEIVSVDSMKIYRGLAVGTAQPTAEDLARVPHHALALVPPTESFSVREYLARAEAAIAAIAARGRPVLLSGGTPLYYKALLAGLFDGPPADEALRAELGARAAREGPETLHAELARVDPAAAKRLHPNDLRRVVRALEVHRLTGEPISDRQVQWTEADGAPPGGADSGSAPGMPSDPPPGAEPGRRYPAALVGLRWGRAELEKRIRARVARMLDAGLLAEAREVWRQRETLARTPLQAVGYKEFFPHFAGERTLDEAVETLVRNTKRLAKAQMTWFRRWDVDWIDRAPGDDERAVAAEAVRLWSARAAASGKESSA